MRQRRSEAGGAAVELTLLAPLLLLFLLLVVALGRVAAARADVDGAARDGARAASNARSAAQANNLATDAVQATLGDAGVTCRSLGVAVDVSGFRSGGWVATEVSCGVDLGDLMLLRLPGTHQVRSRFVAPVDAFRGTS